MSKVRIGHAYGDENGGGRGGKAGDQTGKEVRIQDWYIRSGGWQYYLEPTNHIRADIAAHFMEVICKSNHFGYDRDDRWTGYDLIKAEGLNGKGKAEFDCSSLVLSCYRFAGYLGLKEKYGSTSTMVNQLKPWFIVHTESKYLNKSDYLKRGGILVTAGKHTCMVLDDGAKAVKPVGLIKVAKDTNVRTKPDTTGDILRVVKGGDTIDFYSIAESGWYKVTDGYLSNKNAKELKEVEYWS